jgi:hypothetical protein
MSPRVRVLVHGALLLHASIWGLWLVYTFALAPEPPQRDWYVLREVAVAFVHGDFGSLYIDRQTPDGWMFFQYPPFVLYALAPLALVPPMVAYAFVCAIELAAAGATLALVFRLRHTADADLAVAGVFGSAAMSSVIVSGQSSALLTVVVAAATVACAGGRSFLAGALVGLLLAKPNWLPVFAAFVVWKGGRRALAGLAVACAALVASTLPLGTQPWVEFFQVPAHVQGFKHAYPAFKEITLLAFMKGLGISPSIALPIWAVTFVVLGGLLVLVWRSRRPLGRQLAATTLFAIALNPYVQFYDGLVLAIPAVVWLTHRDTYPHPAWRRIGLIVGAYWIWDMAVFYYAPMLSIAVGTIADPPFSLAGLLLYLWFRFEIGPTASLRSTD